MNQLYIQKTNQQDKKKQKRGHFIFTSNTTLTLFFNAFSYIGNKMLCDDEMFPALNLACDREGQFCWRE